MTKFLIRSDVLSANKHRKIPAQETEQLIVLTSFHFCFGLLPTTMSAFVWTPSFEVGVMRAPFRRKNTVALGQFN
jgi:hypothetical protein